MIDTHYRLDLAAFDPDRDAVIARAAAPCHRRARVSPQA